MNSPDSPICTVCIANYNGMDVLGPCIESIYNQDADFPVEIIVHDDASTDDSAHFIQTHFPDVVLIDSRENVGFCKANNRMAQKARGKYLLLFNNDAVLHKDGLKSLLHHADNQSPPGILTLPQYNIQTGELIDRGEILDSFLNPVPNLDPQKRDVGMVIGACLWIPKALWEELGGFPEWFENIAEDMYLCCAARLKGYPVQTLPFSGYDHWAGKSFGGGKLVKNTMRTTYRRRALSERNKSFVMLLYYPFPLMQILFPVHILFLLFEGMLLSLIKRDMRILREIYFPCFKSLLHEWNRLLKLRYKIQKSRCITLKNLFAVHTFIPYKLTMLLKYGMPAIK